MMIDWSKTVGPHLQTAKEFGPDAKVVSEMAARAIVIHALAEHGVNIMTPREQLARCVKLMRSGRPADPRDGKQWDKELAAAERMLEEKDGGRRKVGQIPTHRVSELQCSDHVAGHEFECCLVPDNHRHSSVYAFSDLAEEWFRGWVAAKQDF